MSEFYAVSAGLAPLNTALIQSKHRYFLRDGRDGVEGRAPGGYVEYVLATWLRALRFLQALETAADRHGIPGGARLIAGTVGLNTDLACILGQGGHGSAQAAPAAAPVASPDDEEVGSASRSARRSGQLGARGRERASAQACGERRSGRTGRMSSGRPKAWLHYLRLPPLPSLNGGFWRVFSSAAGAARISPRR